MWKSIAKMVVCASLLAGCGVTELESATSDDSETVAEELSTSSKSWVTVRRDIRKCAYPMCGGWWVQDVNRVNPKEQYVSDLDLTPSNLAQGDMDKVNAAWSLVLRAKLGAQDPQFKTRKLLVYEAYVGLPGITPAADDVFYSAAARDPQITCITAPCNNEVATKLNYTAKTNFTGYDVSHASKPHVDQEWLIGRVSKHGAIVAAHFRNGNKYPGGYEKILDASQVYIRLPNKNDPCPMFQIRQCPEGQVHVMTRTAEMCMMPAGCVTPGMCAMYMPACDDGYTLSSWSGGQFACPVFACDPTFIVE